MTPPTVRSVSHWMKRLVVLVPLAATAPAWAQAPATTATGGGGAPAAAPAPVLKRIVPPTPPKPPASAPATTAAPPPAVAAAPPAPAPAPELQQLKFLRGRWRCEGTQLGTATFGPEHKFTATAESKAALDGHWDQFTYEERRSKEHHGFRAQGTLGWDQGSKHLVRVTTTNAGDFDLGTAPGLEGDKIVWTGEISGPMGRMPYRHTFTKKSDAEWTLALELKDASGKLVPVTDVVCKR